jgi:hypothetical protein
MASDQGEQRHHEMGAESVAALGADSRSIVPMGEGKHGDVGGKDPRAWEEKEGRVYFSREK